jgi:hypothetical protein
MLVSTSAYCAWAKTPEDTDKKILQNQLEAKAIELFEENKNVYGSRRLSEAFIKDEIFFMTQKELVKINNEKFQRAFIKSINKFPHKLHP